MESKHPGLAKAFKEVWETKVSQSVKRKRVIDCDELEIDDSSKVSAPQLFKSRSEEKSK